MASYTSRHSFVTDALENGGVAQVAELLGHTLTHRGMQHYQHLEKRQHPKQGAIQTNRQYSQQAAPAPKAEEAQ